MTKYHQEHVPAKAYLPGLEKGMRNDVDVSRNTLPPIPLGRRRLIDILQRGVAIIPGAADEVFANAPYRAIKIFLSWPGYPPTDPLITMDLYKRGSRPTRGSLATDLAMLVCRYFERCLIYKIHPSAAKWRIGERGLSASNVIFNAFVNTYGNVWQIDCDVIV